MSAYTLVQVCRVFRPSCEPYVLRYRHHDHSNNIITYVRNHIFKKDAVVVVVVLYAGFHRPKQYNIILCACACIIIIIFHP